MPRMNAITERRVTTPRAELLDRTLIWNQTHLRHAPHEYNRHYNLHRTHRSLAAAAPARALPQPSNPTGSNTSRFISGTRWTASSTNTGTPLELHGRSFGTHWVLAAYQDHYNRYWPHRPQRASDHPTPRSDHLSQPV
ncbi:hypothetical protein [Solihabitans fulvus]|uniref:hypothetical protein n=1 Tax=Solihabitans fulvus TaxID=1892852 RepID=UPI001CB75ED3|nr:hypothetical protein [Solihabitans fulvus]